MASVPLQNVLDKLISTPALVRKLKKSGVLKVKDKTGQTVKVDYVKTAAGYVEFSGADETIRIKVPANPVRP
jgi:hypothetical protein